MTVGLGIRRRLLVNLNQNSSCRSADSCAYFQYFSSRVCWVCTIVNVIHVKRFQCFLVFVSTSVALRIFSSLFLRVPIFSPDWTWMNEWMDEWTRLDINVINVFQCLTITMFSLFRFYINSLAHMFTSLLARPNFSPHWTWMNEWVCWVCILKSSILVFSVFRVRISCLTHISRHFLRAPSFPPDWNELMNAKMSECAGISY